MVAGSNPVHPTKKVISATTKLWLSCLGSEKWELAHKFEHAKQLIAQSEANGLRYFAFAKRGCQDAGAGRRQSEGDVRITERSKVI